MASGVVHKVVQHAERVIHQHVPKVIEIISKGAQDTNPQILNNHRQIAKWLCILADTELILKLTLPGLQGLSLGTLLILEEFSAIETDQDKLSQLLETIDSATSHFCRDDKVLQMLRRTNLNLSKKLATCDLDHKKLLNVEFFCQVIIKVKSL